MSDDFRKFEDERSPELKSDFEAQFDELGNDPGKVGEQSGGQSGDSQALSALEDASDESVEELAETEQALEAAAVEGVEDAADHPERPVHTHEEYGRPDDAPPKRDRDAPENHAEREFERFCNARSTARLERRLRKSRKPLTHLGKALYWWGPPKAGES